ncbi:MULTISPECIES: ATP-binding protein [Asticcacaulis]|uniref:ATP-binding protein n=1 Tax=Asticcacaulis TaxID=76890 RepID=UPI001AE4523B|nr:MULTISPECIES: ATP-binding protein [Asticcacaulis]MBP2157947.1 signal transduction histidine kinase/CheY-like chemotaxis protein [Asticcacaulis solisilvae]MDR6798992.1 signal transduction histidine kinase/CheY-like chemotaxis protein [Asticcacaulis sp. BE141]
MSDGLCPAPSRPAGGWLHYSHLRVEAVIFMLLALTFAAVLGQGAVTNKELIFTPKDGRVPTQVFYPYTYADDGENGKTDIKTDMQRPLKWGCDLKPGAPYPFCGYGMSLVQNGKGKDLSYAQKLHIRMTYAGVGDSMRIVVKTRLPKSLTGKVDDQTMPLMAEFDVVNGMNEIALSEGQLIPETWWLQRHKLTKENVDTDLSEVLAVELVSGNNIAIGHFNASVERITFSGASLSTAQWYLIILGVWLVLTGGFLVFRFLDLRRGYEARRLRLAEEKAVLARAHAAAEAASAAKSQFLANMSHELRTPLNAILGYAQLLKVSTLTDQQMAAVRTIHHSGEHLLTMITDILDIAKVEAGKLELLPAAFDIRACVQTVGQMVRLRAEEKGLTFAVTIAADVPDNVVADQKRVRQVLINLLGNAIKFTTHGMVRLDVSVVACGDGAARLRFDVQDTGIGIPEAQIGRIFRPFEQAGNAIDRSSGTGLGLAITHQIVTMMQGEITVESRPGEGSRFRVEAPFPLACADDGDDASQTRAPVAIDGARYDVLIVEDVEANRTLLKTSLSALGFRISEAVNGCEAIERATAHRPDIILMDVEMPVMGGLEAVTRLRARPATAAIPVIIITANPSQDAEAAALSAGANRLLAKPVDLDQLTACIADLLSAGDADAVAPASQTEAAMVAPPADVLDRLLDLARAGNLRAIRKELPGIIAMSPQYEAFAGRLDALTATYQSPAVLRLIEQYAYQRTAA